MASFGRKLALAGFVVVVAGAGIAYALTKPKPHPAEYWAGLGEPDLKHGETLFWTGGCASCHAAKGASGEDLKVLSGGRALPTAFGTFNVPNISSNPTAGIGGWTVAQFGDAMTRGVGPKGEHLFPSFPYSSYARMTKTDINDLFGYLKNLPASDNVAPPHALNFPFNMRMAVGGWKLLYFSDAPRVEIANASEQVKRGQYLVEGPGHCGECHTPRNVLGGFQAGMWLAGGPNPEGEGRIPDITPGSETIGKWSADEIANYLETGFTPDFDSVGGTMVEVQQNMAHLPKDDLGAIAAYLKAVPAH